MRLGVICRKTQAAKTFFMYKSINGPVPTYVSDSISPSVGEISTYTVRNQHDIIVPFCRTDVSCKSCIPSSISAWNSLDKELRNSPSLASFKYRLKSIKIIQVFQHTIELVADIFQFYTLELEIILVIYCLIYV